MYLNSHYLNVFEILMQLTLKNVLFYTTDYDDVMDESNILGGTV